MKRMNAILTATLMLSTWSCSRAPRADEIHVTGPEAATSVDRDVAAQNRINGFMYVAVVPKLQACWRRLQGKGDIVFKYTYHRSGTNWVWNKHEVESSTLQKDQEPVALQCMGEAARDTSFPMEAAEAMRKGDDLVIHWEWPVPFPSDVTTLGRMIGTGDRETCLLLLCVTCDCPFIPGSGVICTCKSSCSGYTRPCTEEANKKGCTMKLPECISGLMGGFRGGVIAQKLQP
jgi:hypothetical protein